LVVMFDTYGPKYPRRYLVTTRFLRRIYKYIQRLSTHLSNLIETNLSSKGNYINVHGKKFFKRAFLKIRRKLNPIKQDLPEVLVRVHASQMSMAKQRSRHFRQPRRFDGRLVLFRASHQPFGIYPNPTLGWESIVGDSIEVYEVPGHHSSLIYEPRVRKLQEKLNEIIKEVQDGEGG
jgi:thioesterase domain-containing protein